MPIQTVQIRRKIPCVAAWNPPESVRIRPSTESVRIPNRHPRVFVMKADAVEAVAEEAAEATTAVAADYAVLPSVLSSDGVPPFHRENPKLDLTLTRHHENIFPRTRAIFTYSVAKHMITRVVTISG